MIDDRIVLRPFPLGIADPVEKARLATQYRINMLRQAGIAIYLFGTRRSDTGAVIDATGVKEEAVRDEAVVVPVGCTGGMSAKLHRKVMNDFAAYYPDATYRPLLEELGQPGAVEQVVARILAVVKRLRSETVF